ncbi:transient receptor potential cation channel subfamily a member 1-like [Gigaspora margarita]|uniref:Transient receptor potential cation channel subfamily a member 1-like n=1 Tax=Gigaspora margarita TaxID=4874 RepID=A0A8H4EW57_GIGMA|nr:transient receptor potential cation channel subfamily a member 1-like [Gigaspora margarita]
MSEFEETIVEIDQTKPHNGITALLLSPNGEYAVTWSRDDKSICGWQINNQPIRQSVEQSTKELGEQSENKSYQFEFKCLVKVGDKCPLAVSNNKDVVIGSIEQSEYIRFAPNFDKKKDYIIVIDLATKNRINLKLDWGNIASIKSLRFYNGDLYIYMCTSTNVHLLDKHFEENDDYINKFSPKILHKKIWAISDSISCGYQDVTNCYLSVEGKIMLLDRCGSLTQWNLNTLLFEKQYQLYTNCPTNNSCHCIFSKNSTLLAVNTDEFIYTYLTDNSMLLSQCKLNNILSQLEFISIGGEERLLLIFNNGNLEIRNPYDLQYVINDKISVLYDELLNKGMKPDVQKEEFKRLIDGKIYYVSDERLWVQKVSKEQWRKYLLKDKSKIRGLPIKSVIVEILQKYEHKYDSTDVNQSYIGSLVKWEISNKNVVNVLLKKNFDSNKWEFVDNIDLYNNSIEERVIYGYELLHNDDLAMITSLGLFIWSIWNKFKKIRLRYYIYWTRGGRYALKNLQKYENNLLPAPDFDFITKNCENFRLRTKERCFFKELFKERYCFKELLEDYIENDDLLTKLYGQDLLKFYLKTKNYEMVENLYNKIFYKIENNDFLERIRFLEIFTFSFIELTQYPQILKEFLSYTLFIYTTNNIEDIEIDKFVSEQHLQNHIKPLHPFFINLFISNIYKLFFLYLINLLLILYLFIKIVFFFPVYILLLFIFKDPDEFAGEIMWKMNPNKTFKYIILIFPLPKFSSYDSNYNPWKELIFPSPSIFSKHEFPELYKYWHGEALINFKWNAYGKYYFFAIFNFYFIFMLSFLIVATIKELSSNTQNLLLITTIFLGILHFTFEIRQFIYSPLSWITDIWNYFDIGAILFPVLTSINWLQSSTTPIWAITISILLLELKFITFFRAIEFGGTHWAMIIGVIHNSLSFFVIIGFIMLAFAHSLYVLLRPISNDLNNSEELNTNMFTNLYTAYLAVYMMLTGDSSSLSDWSSTGNLTLIVLIVLFSFFTTIYLMNLFIGLLSNFISESNKKELFLLQRAKILSEIELFYMLPYQRRKKNWFPELIFYRFSLDKLYDIVTKIQNNNWDDTIEKPYLPNSLLKIISKDKVSDKDNLLQKVEEIEKKIQESTANENKIIQKLEEKLIQKLDDNNKIIKELKIFLLKEEG